MAFHPTNVPTWREFTVAYASALHASGASTAALEAEVSRVLDARNVTGSVMATPTALWVEVGEVARVVRVEPCDPKLDLQAVLHEIGSGVACGSLPPSLALRRIERLIRSPGPYPPAVSFVAFVGSSAGTAVLLGGTLTDAIVAGLISVVVFAVSGRLSATEGWSRLADGMSAFAAAALAQIFASTGASPPLVALAAVIMLAPGLRMTIGAAETAAGHWSSGAARFAGATAALVQLAAGLTLPQTFLPAWTAQLTPVALPPGSELVSAIVVPLALGVLVRVRPVDLVFTAAISAAAYACATAIPGPTGALAGAAAATILANGLGRLRGRASSGLALPALLMLVPGSVGVEGVALLLDRDVVAGLETAVGAAIAASALAAGILLGHAVVQELPPLSGARRSVDVASLRGYRMAGPSENR